MTPPVHEKGAALLTVLLLVAVMSTVAATAMDRLNVSTRLVGNAAAAAQTRYWISMAELLAAARIEDLLAADRAQTVAGAWLERPQTIDLPTGGRISARVSDGGNCFNLNSLVTRAQSGELVAEPRMVAQFANLMRLLGVDGGKAANVAAAAADWIDSDSKPLPGGTEDASYSGRLTANAAMVDPSEIRVLPAMTPQIDTTLRPWLCALPIHEPSAINVNTLLPDQAPLIAMLAPEQVPVEAVRAQLANRPASGFGSVLNFWQSGPMQDVTPPAESASQVKVRSSWFVLSTLVDANGAQFAATSLIDARETPAVPVRRFYGTRS